MQLPNFAPPKPILSSAFLLKKEAPSMTLARASELEELL